MALRARIGRKPNGHPWSSDICYVRNTSSEQEEKDVVVFENDLNGAFHGAEVEVQIIGNIKDKNRSSRKRGRVLSKSFSNKRIIAQLKCDSPELIPAVDSHLLLEPYNRRPGEFFPRIIASVVNI